MNITVTRQMPGGFTDSLNRVGQVILNRRERPMTRAVLTKSIREAGILICMVNDRIDEALLKHAKFLRCVITYSVGVDHIDLQALKRRRIRLVHMPHLLTEATAELALTLMFCCARRIRPALEYMGKGKFIGYGPTLFLGQKMSGSTLGIIGMGRIGRAVAEKATAFGMKILYTTPHRLGSDEESALRATYVPLITLLKQSDIVSIHCSLHARTKRLIGKSQLCAMKQTAILVNTSRGPILDEKALVRHLKSHPHFHAGLDVYEREPKVAAGLLRLHNAVCLPHIGSAEACCRGRIAKICVEEAIRFAKGETLRYEYVLGTDTE